MGPPAVLRAPEVVCVAASTGGPQAIGAFLDALTAPPPCPVIIVQHMPGSFTGRFADRLDRRTRLCVREAVSGDALRGGEILVAPGHAHLRIRHRRVRSSDEAPVAGLRPRADLTLIDLAVEYGAGATAVILSGMGSDGFHGSLAVAEAGGQVLVQDTSSSSVDGMPARVRKGGLATLVGSPATPATALDAAWQTETERPIMPDDGGPATIAGEHRSHPPGTGPTTSIARHRRGSSIDAATEQLFAVLHRLELVDLHWFKPAQTRRNLATFADQRGYDLDDLIAALEHDAPLRQALMDRLTINVTSFFRDPDRWDDLTRLVIPHLGPTPRVWNPGCANGSETCSLAMLLVESGRRPHIWATDVNATRIEAAQIGIYEEVALDDIAAAGAPHRWSRWFRPTGDRLSVTPDLRSHVHYERHDALNGPVDPPFDLVLCRNLIIYLTTDGRDRLISRIAGSQSPGGVVLLGSAERILRPEVFGLTRIAPGLYRRDATGGGS